MIVLDASAVVELLLATRRGREISEKIEDPELSLHVPHLADLEVAQVLRRLVLHREMTAKRAAEALTDLRDLDLERHAHEPLLDRVWALHENLTAYDAAYVALAESLGAVLLTCDRRIADAPGLAVGVELVE